VVCGEVGAGKTVATDRSSTVHGHTRPDFVADRLCFRALWVAEDDLRLVTR
jgi:hypothetical protein